MGPVNAADGPPVAKIDDTRGGTLGELLLVVASIGVLAVSGTEAGTDELLRKADQAMYAAKRAGKDRVVQVAM